MSAGNSKPVLYYTFENGTGTTVTDRSDAGNNLDGGFYGDWDGTNKKRGSYSADFGSGETAGNGKPTPDSDSIGDLTTFAFIHQTRVWTISTWLRQTATSYRAICGNTASDNHGVALFYSGGIRVHFGGSYHTFSGTTLSADTWYHVLVTCTGAGAGKVKCYIDGDLKDSGTAAATETGNSANTWVVGNTGFSSGHWTGESLLGQLDEYSVWDVAFTDDDVTNIYNGGTPYDVSSGLDNPRPIDKFDGIAVANIRRILGIEAADAGKIDNVMGIAAPAAWGFANGWAINVDGSNEYLSIADHADFDFEYNSAFSLSAWVKTSSSSWRGIINKKITSSTGGVFTGWDMGIFNGNVFCSLTSNWASTSATMACTSGDTLNDGAWHHVAVTFSGAGDTAGTSIYIDGEPQTETTYASRGDVGTNTIQNSQPVRIGNMPVNGAGDTWWNGGIDEVSIWNKELSSSEIDELFGDGAPGGLNEHSAEADLISWWRMGDGDGDSSDSSDAGARIYDQKGSHDATPTNTESGDINDDAP